MIKLEAETTTQPLWTFHANESTKEEVTELTVVTDQEKTDQVSRENEVATTLEGLRNVRLKCRRSSGTPLSISM